MYYAPDPGMREHLERLDLARQQYEKLPECIKTGYTYKDWLWIDDAGKAKLIQSETEPEY